ncbi:multidrug efflux system outer membrane protein [Crenobacter luteus]|uniref:efflux transporter outer membrane subunit n=1 Tax=Crenobacter luteus TaxID=1452487 RepID=UPI00104C6591|nr:efflux transporter outer membrane subunit [Crenobacter luteus]TCP13585.1 multidrug efflux system outer membrane protein [Crenobacter luteus]
MMKRLLPLAAAVALSACAVGPDYQRPGVELPDSWTSAPAAGPGAAEAAALDARWWERFGDAELSRLIDEALAHNRDLVAAAARVDEAAALSSQARAALLPRLDANAGYSRGRRSAETSTPGSPLVSDVRSANAVLSWEADLWGGLRRGNEAARAEFAASRYSREASRLAIAAQVADSYFQLRAFDAQLQIARDTLNTREQTLKLQERRFKGGVTSALDLRQAEAEAAAARAAVPTLEQSVGQTERALSVLVGKSPRTLATPPARGKTLAALAIPPAVPAGLPSELLARRPDLAAAEARLVAANARIGEARAAYFPSIKLTAQTGSESLALASLFSGPARTWAFVANLAMPVFDFGATAARVDAANARQRQALAGYEKAVQDAFRETFDALQAQGTSADAEAALATQARALRDTLRLARLRYDNGYSNYLEVLDAERGVYRAEQALIDARLTRLRAVLALYKAMGGGWQNGDATPG